MASYNEPSSLVHWKRYGIYKMELIYVQTRLNGQGNPELALEIRKKERLTITIFKHLDWTLLVLRDKKICWKLWMWNLESLWVTCSEILVFCNVLYVAVTGRKCTKCTLFLSLLTTFFDFAMLKLCQVVSQKAQIWFSVIPVYLLKVYQIRAWSSIEY